MNRRKLFSHVVNLTLLCSGMLFADGSEDCQSAIRNQVFHNNPKAEKVVFASDSERRQEQSRDETLYTGLGRYLRHTGEWVDIHWQCVYNHRQNTVASASYGPVSDTPPDNNPQHWVQICQNAVHDKIHSENQAVGKATYETANESRLSNEESMVEGTGWVIINGKDVKFNYRCVFNFPSGQVTERKYNLR